MMGYADDSSFFLPNFRCIEKVERVYDDFEPVSGARLKGDKTKILTVVPDADDTVNLKYEKYIVEELKVLGVKVTKLGITADVNFGDFMEDLHAFDRRPPHVWTSTSAKVQSFNTFILSKLWHRATVAEVPVRVINKVYESLDGFLKYPNAKNKVAREKMHLPKEEGGVNYPDIQIKVHCMRIMKLIDRTGG